MTGLALSTDELETLVTELTTLDEWDEDREELEMDEDRELADDEINELDSMACEVEDKDEAMEDPNELDRAACEIEVLAMEDDRNELDDDWGKLERAACDVEMLDAKLDTGSEEMDSAELIIEVTELLARLSSPPELAPQALK